MQPHFGYAIINYDSRVLLTIFNIHSTYYAIFIEPRGNKTGTMYKCMICWASNDAEIRGKILRCYISEGRGIDYLCILFA